MGTTVGQAAIGPLEQQYRRSAAFRAASGQSRVTSTHWHIAIANRLGVRRDRRGDLRPGLAAVHQGVRDFGAGIPLRPADRAAVAKTWPARLRGQVIGIDRGNWPRPTAGFKSR